MSEQKQSRKPGIAIVAASPMTIKSFMLPHVRAWAERWSVTVLVNASDDAFFTRQRIQARIETIGIHRHIRPQSDAPTLLDLWRRFRREKYSAVFSITPKAGLLAMLAAKLAGVPVRIHVFTGQVWATRQGFTRGLLKCADRLIAACATHVLFDSQSQREFVIKEGVVSADNSRVLAQGSICGVDTQRFKPDSNTKIRIRQRLVLPEEAVLLLFLGRLNRDKGVLDLAEAFAKLTRSNTTAHLLFVGPDEAGMRLQIETICSGASKPRLHFVDFTEVPEDYMAAADIFCLPSYREGFGTVVIEAAAAGLPAVASRIYGLTDAVDAGRTGLLHEAGNVDDLVKKLKTLLDDQQLRLSLGVQARQRAINDFSEAAVVAAYRDYLEQCL